MWRRLLRIQPPLSKLFLIGSGTYLSIFHPYKGKIMKITSCGTLVFFLWRTFVKKDLWNQAHGFLLIPPFTLFLPFKSGGIERSKWWRGRISKKVSFKCFMLSLFMRTSWSLTLWLLFLRNAVIRLILFHNSLKSFPILLQSVMYKNYSLNVDWLCCLIESISIHKTLIWNMTHSL